MADKGGILIYLSLIVCFRFFLLGNSPYKFKGETSSYVEDPALSKVGNHPEIGSLIRRRDEIYQLISMGDYRQTCKQLKILFLELKPIDRASSEGKTFLSDVDSAITGIRKSTENGRNFAHSGGLRLTYVHENEETYYDLYSDLNAILWDKGYLFDQNYRGIDLKAFDPKISGEIQ